MAYALIVSTVVTLALSAWFFVKKNHNVAVVLLLAGGLALRFYAASDPYLHPWDERYHALVAKNLLDDPLKPVLYARPVLDFEKGNWPASHIWLHKQPFPLWSMAASIGLFGLNEYAVRLPSILLSVLGIAIMFWMGKRLFNVRVAYVASFLYGIHGLIIELAAGRTSTDHIDLFFLVFIQLGCFFALRYAQEKRFYDNVLCGVFTGIAILCKWLPALIVIPVWVGFCLSQRHAIKSMVLNGILMVAVMAAIFLPWQVYALLTFPEEYLLEMRHNSRHLTQVLDQMGGPFYFHLDHWRIIFGELIYLVLGWFFWKTFKQPQRWDRWALSLWILIPLTFFSVAATKMKAYTLFVAPAMFLITGLMVEYLWKYRGRFTSWLRWLAPVLVLLLIALPIRYSIERSRIFDSKERDTAWAGHLRSLAKASSSPNLVILNYPHAIEAMFYTDVVAYADLPSIEAIGELENQGYTVAIYNGSYEQRAFDDLTCPLLFDDLQELVNQIR